MIFKRRFAGFRNKMRRRKKGEEKVENSLVTRERADDSISTSPTDTITQSTKHDQSNSPDDRYQPTSSMVAEETKECRDENEMQNSNKGDEWDISLKKKYEDAVIEATKQRTEDESLWLRSHTLSKEEAVTKQECYPGGEEQHRLWLRSHTLSQDKAKAIQQEQEQKQRQENNHPDIDIERQRTQSSETSLQVLYRLVASGMDFMIDDRRYETSDYDSVSDTRDDCDDDSRSREQSINIRCVEGKTDAPNASDNDEMSEISGLSLTKSSRYGDVEESAYFTCIDNGCGLTSFVVPT